MIAIFFIVLSFYFLIVLILEARKRDKEGIRALAATNRWCDLSEELFERVLGEDPSIVFLYPDVEELAERYIEAAREFYETHPFLSRKFEEDPLVRLYTSERG